MRKFFADAFFVQLLNLLVKPVWILVIDRGVQNLLPAEAYVAYYSWLSVSILLVILLDMGINTWNNTRVAADNSLIGVQFYPLFKVKVRLAALYAVAMLFAAFIIGIKSWEIIILAAIIGFQIVSSFSQFFRSNITAMHLYKTEGILSVTDRLFAVIVCALFLYIPSLNRVFNIQIFILIQLIGVLLAAIIGFLILAPHKSTKAATHPALPFFGLLKKTWPYALLVTLMAIYTRIDVVMIRLLNADAVYETEAYAMGYRLLDAATMFMAVFSGLLLPAFSSRLKESNALMQLASKVFGIINLLLIPAVIFIFLFKEYSILLLYPNKTNVAAPTVTALLSGVLPAAAAVYIYGALLTAAAHLKYLNRLALSMVLLNIAGNAVLIPAYGSMGAAIATLVTQGIFAAGCIWGCYAFFNWKWPVKSSIIWLLWVVALYLLANVLKAELHAFILILVLLALSLLSGGWLLGKSLKDIWLMFIKKQS